MLRGFSNTALPAGNHKLLGKLGESSIAVIGGLFDANVKLPRR
jgi:hypothetical protein